MRHARCELRVPMSGWLLAPPDPLGKVFTLQPEEKINIFSRKFLLRLRKGVDGKLFFAKQKTAVPY